MKPTKSNDLIKKTAQDLNLSEELVRDVVNFYYSVVNKKIANLENTTIFLHGLGTLRISRRKLQKSIESLTRLINSNSQDDFKLVVKHNLSKKMLEQQIKCLEECNAYYKEIDEKRNKNLES